MSSEMPNASPENIFQLIFEKSPGSLLVKADLPKFTILAASDAYLKVTSTTRESVLGKGFSEVFPEDSTVFNVETNARNIFTKVIKTRLKVDVPNYRFDVYNPDKKICEIHYWSCSNTPILDDNNEVAYILNTVIDITEEVKAKEVAIESESRLRLAAEAAALGTWDLNLNDQTFICSPRFVEIFGHHPETVVKLADISQQVNADDLQNIVIKAYNEALITGKYLYEVRVYWPDGSLHWIKIQGIVLYDEEKKPITMLGTILDITESKRDEIRKNDFIAIASHELKTPLTSIKAYIQLLSRKLSSLDDSFINNALLKTSYQINKMSDLVYRFLDLSKIEADKLQLKIESFDINKLIYDVIAEADLVNPGNRILFAQQDVIVVHADKEKIEQVISNLLNNAIKYSDKGSIINVQSQKIDGNVHVTINDKGIGIKPKDQEKLFQRFYRVESEKMKNISGFGIGLYLASEIIQRHNGQIGVESKEEQGSTFYFSLPLTD
ncbi:MAG: yycG 5 [Mucilaginibacter sp.]|nr:yycG 5 [Mucilaginibacter sp.]